MLNIRNISVARGVQQYKHTAERACRCVSLWLILRRQLLELLIVTADALLRLCEFRQVRCRSGSQSDMSHTGSRGPDGYWYSNRFWPEANGHRRCGEFVNALRAPRIQLSAYRPGQNR